MSNVNNSEAGVGEEGCLLELCFPFNFWLSLKCLHKIKTAS